jgi:hypothetical protein
MRRGQGGRVPYPTQDEINEAALQDNSVQACSGIRYGQLIVLKVAFRNGNISTVYSDRLGVRNLLAVLKALIPNSELVPASRLTDGPLGPQTQQGHMVG